MKRRNFLYASTGAVTALVGGSLAFRKSAGNQAMAAKFEVTKTEAEWRAQLTPAQFNVLRKEGTEAPFTSPLLHEKRTGIFHCAGCNLPVYSSETKFDSGTGWPSFYQALPNGVATKEDKSLFMVRTEAHCRRCGGHLGHVFDDGPPPTGKRHCIDGVALTFQPKAES